MKRFAFLLWILTLAAGCIVEDKPVGTGGTGGTVCGTCQDPTPACNPLTNLCVECTSLQVDYCTEQGLICDVDRFQCIGCVTDIDCTAIDAAKCDPELKECVPCDSGAQCQDAEGLPGVDNACDDEGVCVDCTPATEEQTCPGRRSCDPATKRCTETTVGSVDVCEACVADSECSDNGEAFAVYRCVPMFYPTNPETRFPNELTGFCLKTTDGGCQQPYSIPLPSRASLSGSEPAAYCGINEDLATCLAVNALVGNERCPGGTDDECPISGICRDVGPVVNRCTYLCDLPVQCPAGAPADTCGSSGGGGDDYCGG